jgi:hypothetical protein
MPTRKDRPDGDHLTTLTQFLRAHLDDPSDGEVHGCLRALRDWCVQVAQACHAGGAAETARIFRDIAAQMAVEANTLEVDDLEADDEADDEA